MPVPILVSAMHICTDSYVLSLASDHVYELRSVVDTEESWAKTRKGSAYGRHLSIRTNPKHPGFVNVSFENQDIGRMNVRRAADAEILVEFVHYWNSQVGPTDATTARIAELFGDYQKLVRSRKLSVSAVTWNCCGKLAEYAEKKTFKFIPTTDVVIVAIQESDQLNRSVTASASTHTTASDTIIGALGTSKYSLVSSVQLLGLMTLVYVRKSLEEYAADDETSTTSTGFMGVWGNKGATLNRLKLFNDPVLGGGIEFKIVNCHLSAGEGTSQLERRRWELGEIASHFRIPGLVPSSLKDPASVAAESEDSEVSSMSDLNASHERIEMEYGDSDSILEKQSSDKPTHSNYSIHSLKRDHIPAKFTIVLGDLNYRILLEEKKAKALLSSQSYDQLLRYDSLRKEISTASIFRGFVEPPIKFAPTYKYVQGSDELSTRVPSYTDRIMYSGNCSVESYDSVDQRQSDHRPVCLQISMACDYIDSLERGMTVGRSLRMVDAAENRVRPRLAVEPATADLVGGPLSTQAVWLSLDSEIVRPLRWTISSPSELKISPSQGELTPDRHVARILVKATMPVAPDGDEKETQHILVVRPQHKEQLEKYAVVNLKTLPSCVGASVERMCQMSRGARNGLSQELATNLPKQILACTDYLVSRFSSDLLDSSYYPSVFDQVLLWLDQGRDLDEEVLDAANRDHELAGCKAVWSVLLCLFQYMPKRLLHGIDSPQAIFSKLPPVSANVLAFIVGFIKQVLSLNDQCSDIYSSFSEVLFDSNNNTGHTEETLRAIVSSV